MADPPQESTLPTSLRHSLLGDLQPSLPVRRAPEAAPPESEHPLSSARFAGEDFLYHLYRGSELLQDNCVEEAKEELERAIRMQPLDVEGQGLLGVVYFRLGLYPRAIEIYREITRACPDEITPKLNLSLCYLKTGQPSEAKDLLEDVLRRSPDHRRACGYLGLSFERMGDYARAQAAFERAGQPHLARRMQQLLDELTQIPSEPQPPREEIRRAAAEAVAELESGPEAEPFARELEDPSAFSLRVGRWRAHEPGQEAVPSALPAGLATAPRPGPTKPVPDIERALSLLASQPSATPPQPRPLASGNALTTAALLANRSLQLPAEGATRNADGLVFAHVRESFAVRGDRLRASTHEAEAFSASTLRRRARGKESEENFGTGASWLKLSGHGLLVLEPGRDRELVLLRLGTEFIYLRESRLVAFDGALRYENGRLPASDPGPVPMVQLSGEGYVVFEANSAFAALPVTAGRQATVRAASVVGWTGRLLGQALPSDRAAQYGSGFVDFNGEGAVLVDDP